MKATDKSISKSQVIEFAKSNPHDALTALIEAGVLSAGTITSQTKVVDNVKKTNYFIKWVNGKFESGQILVKNAYCNQPAKVFLTNEIIALANADYQDYRNSQKQNASNE